MAQVGHLGAQGGHLGAQRGHFKLQGHFKPQKGHWRLSMERSIEASEVNLGLRVGNFDFREATRGLREATSDFL